MEDNEILEQPVASVEAEPTPVTEPAVETDANLWSDLASDTDEDLVPSSTPETSPAPVAVETKPAGPDSAATLPATAAPVQDPAPPVAQPPVSPAPLPKAEAQPTAGVTAPQPPTTEQLLVQRQQLIDTIADRYSFSEDQIAAVQTEPEKVLPRMAAQIQVETFENVLNVVMAQIPQIIAMERYRTAQENQYNEQFYGRWPALRDQRFNARLQEVALAYRQANPRATPEQAIESIGAMVHVMEGIPVQPPASAAAPAAVAPQRTPASSMRPPAPAGVGASARPAAVPTTPNIFEELSLFEG